MRKKRHTPEEIVSKLRQADVLVAQGTPERTRSAPSGSRRSASGRVAGWGDLLHAAGGQGRDRELAAALQYQAPACFAGLQTSRSGGVRARLCGLAGGAIPTGFAGQAPRSAQAFPEPTVTPDHPMGADHRAPALEHLWPKYSL